MPETVFCFSNSAWSSAEIMNSDATLLRLFLSFHSSYPHKFRAERSVNTELWLLTHAQLHDSICFPWESCLAGALIMIDQ